ncbi:hypothetical protein M6B38_340350 [Iris pallida]|uniref:Uncharacterized protein n=1 Tax=Iris pallida TaxID=29817 RepID=A0AAX6GXV4_IRIPA|nr:hypothetical protein M6B38_340350 [Iris pallida]
MSTIVLKVLSELCQYVVKYSIISKWFGFDADGSCNLTFGRCNLHPIQLLKFDVAHVDLQVILTRENYTVKMLS